MAQHNTKVCKTWRARECVYVTLSYSLCSGSHLLLHLKPHKGQSLSTLICRTSEAAVLSLQAQNVSGALHADTGSKNATQLKYHIIKVGGLGYHTLNFLQVTQHPELSYGKHGISHTILR